MTKPTYENDPGVLRDVRSKFRPKGLLKVIGRAREIHERAGASRLHAQFAAAEAKKATLDRHSSEWASVHAEALRLERLLETMSPSLDDAVSKLFASQASVKLILGDLVELYQALEAAKGKVIGPIERAFAEVGCQANAANAVCELIAPLERFIAEHVRPAIATCEAHLRDEHQLRNFRPADYSWILNGTSWKDVELS